MPSRRDFIKACGLSAPLLAALPSSVFARTLTAEPSGSSARTLVLLRLGGGNDGLNTVIPAEDDLYRRARPTLGIGPKQAHSLGQGLFLHPAMKGMKTLYDEGLVSVINSVGYPEPDRSHFRSMDIWHTARPDHEDRRNGWLGRALDPVAPSSGDTIPAIAVLKGDLPLALAGGTNIAPVVPSFRDLLLKNTSLRRLAAMRRRDPGDPLQHLSLACNSAAQASAKLQDFAEQSPEESLPGTGLGQQLGTILALMRANLGTQVYYTSLDGFDTHNRQAELHAGLLSELSGAIASFFQVLRQRGEHRNVLLVTFSEFGRRVAENGSQGTDHGAAAPLFCVSGNLNPGIIGKAPDLENTENGDLKYDIDFRRVYATILDRWLELDSTNCLGNHFEPLPFLNDRT